MTPRYVAAFPLFLCSIFITIPLAMLLERRVERPFNALGHRIACLGRRTPPHTLFS
jgi:peptidoglycan/LPS O-acetylase OafA/YrhL